MSRKFYTLTPVVISVAILMSCGGDDDSKPAKRHLSFSAETLTVNEADETIEIEVTLDKPATRDITIDFSVAGTARDRESATELGLRPDFEVINDDSEITIEEGETTGTIELEMFSDPYLEDDETIEITLESVSSEDLELPDQNKMTVTVEQQHGIFVVLAWDDEQHDDVDMDLFFWAQDENGDLQALNFVGLDEAVIEGETVEVETTWLSSFSSPEYFFLPSTALEDGDFGLGATYYAGPADQEVDFELAVIEILEGSEEGETVVREGTYTAANLNKWNLEEGTDLMLSLSFTKSGDSYSDFSDIMINETGSRRITSAIPLNAKRK